MTDIAIVLAWLVLAHLVADFVLQNDWIAVNKGTDGRRGWSALLVHGLHVAVCLLPAAFAYGPRGVAYIAIIAASHVLVDRWKVVATRRADAAAQAQARLRIQLAGATPPSGLGAAWTPWPGLLFLADQVLHLAIALVGWLVLLEGVPISAPFVDFANAVFRNWDRTVVHAAILTGVVLVSLFILNTRAAYYFVLALVSPREVANPAPNPAPDAAAAAAPPTGYTVRMGPLVATVEPGVAPAGGAARAPAPAVEATAASAAATSPGLSVPPGVSVPVGAPARIGATIGALERLLIVVLLLTGAEAAVGFVIAAKTIARFKQLDDRGFAEYYLLGTLASVSVAIVTALIAQAALRTLA